MENFFEKSFRLKEHNTNTRTEMIAGFTTFMTMAYILAINPSILSETGMDAGAVFTATAISSLLQLQSWHFMQTILLHLHREWDNAFFAYSVVLGKGHSWQFALTAVFIEGLLFIY